MKKCPKCNVSFADDMNFCLNDGATLIATGQNTPEIEDEQETLIGKPLPKAEWNQQPVTPATVANARPTVTEAPLNYGQGLAPKSNLLKYVALAAGFLIFGTILGVGVMRFAGSAPETPPIAANANQPQNIAANTANLTPMNSNTEITAKIETANQNTQATPQKTASPKPTENKPKGCFLDDNGKGEGEVRVRRDCDILDCENDNSTVAGTYASKTPVKKLGGTASSANYTWTKIKVGGKVVWVASSKIRCN